MAYIEEQVTKLEKSVYSLEKDNELQAKIFIRFEDQVDKLSDLTEAMHILISLHDERIKVNALTVETLKEEMNKEIKELEARVTTQGRELSNKIDASESRILEKIAELKKEWKEEKDVEVEKKATFSEKVNNLFIKFESWKWFIIGAIFTAGIVMGKTNLLSSVISSLFKIP
jgi:hypothetical protein